MVLSETVIALVIYILLPSMGVVLFLKLRHKMIRDQIYDQLIIETFLLFVTYGGLLLVVLTTLANQWSGMASLGSFYLILGAPIIMGAIAYKQFTKKHLSKYHRWFCYWASLYFIIAPTLVVGAIMMEKVK